MVEKYNKVSAIGDGNCAFNAFILGLCEEDTLNNIEKVMQSEGKDADAHLQTFIELASEVLGVKPPNFATLKGELIRLREEVPEQLQVQLAPIMRQIACDQLMQDEECKQSTKAALTSAFWVDALPGAPRVDRDDIFNRHQFIKNKFAKIKSATPPPRQLEREDRNTYLDREDVKQWQEARIKELNIWWEEEGYGQFINGMRNHAVYAGDLELAQLGQYFRVNLELSSPVLEPRDLYRDNGKVPVGLVSNHSEDTRFELYNRGVVDHIVGDHQQFLSLRLANEGLTRRLDCVPDYNKVSAHIKNHQGELRDTEVPKGLSEECLAELKQRGVISLKTDPNTSARYYIFALGKEAAERRIKKFSPDNLRSSILQYSKTEALPTVRLHHEHDHWSFMQKAKADNTLEAAAGDNRVKRHAEPALMERLRKGDFADAPNKWARFVAAEKAKLEAERKPSAAAKPDDPEKTVDYQLGEKTTVKVTKEEQIAYDEQYAKKLQQEEYQAYLEEQRNTRRPK
ncbi:MAG: hypothetical protein A3F18_06045 [Legionellales bacterium RIFCSPHIGHO2_12_FULL_37_14]|nr:MAG: hypothetical protein A3F18_06045 [Legionellales bacterium RIFCSPHIGHO2_12_FULL_37_14]